MQIPELATAVAPDALQKTVGIRLGEKLHEQMIGIEDAPFTYEYKEYYKILPAINGWSDSASRIKDGVLVAEDFIYSSNINDAWMSVKELRAWIDVNGPKIGRI